MLFFSSCDENESSFSQLNDAQSAIEKLNETVENTNFSITLPSGEIVDFTPSEYFSFAGSNSFSSEKGGYTFSNESGGFSISLPDSGSGELQLLGNNYNFSTVYCLSIDEFREKYGFSLESFFDGWEVYFAVSSGNYSEAEIIENGAAIGVDNFLYYYLDPAEPSSYGGFFEKNSDVIYLNDSFTEVNNGVDLVCEGYAYNYDFNPFREVVVGDYSLKLKCD